MFRIRLSNAELTHITGALQTHTHHRLRTRYQALLLVHHGRTQQQVAADLNIHHTTLTQWLRQYRTGGLAKLSSWDLPGPRQRIPNALASTIRRWVTEGQHASGCSWDTWAYEKLAVKVYEETGIQVRRTAMRDFCQRHAIALQVSATHCPQATHQHRPRQDSHLAHTA